MADQMRNGHTAILADENHVQRAPAPGERSSSPMTLIRQRRQQTNLATANLR
jgi:hypothetical protein